MNYAAYPDLRGKRVLITAASEGIGKETALAFLTQGSHVAILSRNLQKLQAAADDIQQSVIDGGNLHTVQVDLTNLKDTRNKAAQAVELLGGLDVLFNNGPGVPEPTIQAMMEGNMDEAQLNTFNANAVSFYAMFDACLPALRASTAASVINMSSVLGFCPSPTSYLVAYNAAKAAVLSMTRDQALLHARDGIRVNAVCPGYTNTAVVEKGAQMFQMTPQQYQQWRADNTPLQMNGEPSDTAAAVLFLASQSSRWITGQYICMDGGMSLTCNTALPPGVVAVMP